MTKTQNKLLTALMVIAILALMFADVKSDAPNGKINSQTKKEAK